MELWCYFELFKWRCMNRFCYSAFFMVRQVFQVLLSSSYNKYSYTMNQKTSTAAVNNDKTWDIKLYVHLQCSTFNANICLLSSFITFFPQKIYSLKTCIEFDDYNHWPQNWTCLYISECLNSRINIYIISFI